MKRKYRVSAEVEVIVELDDQVIVEALTPYEDGTKERPSRNHYGFETDGDVIRHLAFNCVANGEESGRILDGFVDVGDEVSMQVDRGAIWTDRWDVELIVPEPEQ